VMDRRDSNRLEARRELRRKPRRANERRTNVRGTFGRQPWTSERGAIPAPSEGGNPCLSAIKIS
ncbi:MAG: hypothetical protein WC146_02695, partial [Patescibacteria group bacterium]